MNVFRNAVVGRSIATAPNSKSGYDSDYAMVLMEFSVLFHEIRQRRGAARPHIESMTQ